MKASVVTVCFNSAGTIARTIESVNRQDFLNIEHVFIDGVSVDETVKIISLRSSREKVVLSERDKGIYDAMNKGVALTSGDFIGFLNSDDYYFDNNVISRVAEFFNDPSVGFVFGDLNMVNKKGEVIRKWRPGVESSFRLKGRQIPHPVFFVRAELIRNLDTPFDPSYRISADLKQQLLLVNKYSAKGVYMPRVLVEMTVGGASTKSLSAYILGWQESIRAYNEVFGRGGFLFTARKVVSKLSGTSLKYFKLNKL